MPGDPVIGLVIATMLEAEPFIKGLALAESETDPFPIYTNHPRPSPPHQGGRKKEGCSFSASMGGQIYLIISGIGKGNAAMACSYIIQRYHPVCVCNVGAAGAVVSSYHIGECRHITKVIEPDRPELTTGVFHAHIPDVIDGFPTAILATQDRPVRDPAERKKVAMDAQLVDMEGASVVQACKRFLTKCYLFKFVSDTPDHGTSNDIVKNVTFHRNAFFLFFHDTVLAHIVDISFRQ
jgi:adenosylhomocysteine nucleosidase